MAKTIQPLTAVTATNSPPSGASAGKETNDLKSGGNVPDQATVLVASTAGSGTMTVTIRMWGYSAAATEWFPLGYLNKGNAIAEETADQILYTERLEVPGHFERLYAEITAIAGTSTAISCWVVVEDQVD